MNQAVKSSLRSQVSDAIEEYDYEAIEQAVMESPRGRWFLREYLKRHREADTTRLAEAMQRLAQAMRGNTAQSASDTAQQLRALIQDALAEAANDLSSLLKQQHAETTPPGLAAGRLEALVQQLLATAEAKEAPPATVSKALPILRSLFSRLSCILGEPRPQAAAAPRTDEPPAPPKSAQPAPAPQPVLQAQAHTALDAANNPCAPCRPRLRIQPRPQEPATHGNETASVRINIKRRTPEELHIPMPQPRSSEAQPHLAAQARTAGQSA